MKMQIFFTNHFYYSLIRIVVSYFKLKIKKKKNNEFSHDFIVYGKVKRLV